MARKSRKPNNKVEIPNFKPSLIQVAAYVRLSLEDRSQKGNSIENQQRIISSYIEEHSDFELYDTYIDSNVSHLKDRAFNVCCAMPRQGRLDV